MTELHVTTHKAWIYYSDIFGIGMLVIVFTGMFIQRGSLSFRQRGWKLPPRHRSFAGRKPKA